MSTMNFVKVYVFAALLVPGVCAYGADASPAAPGVPMKMDEPMPSKMAKRGTRKGDVKKAAEKKEREMKPMLEKESASEAKK